MLKNFQLNGLLASDSSRNSCVLPKDISLFFFCGLNISFGTYDWAFQGLGRWNIMLTASNMSPNKSGLFPLPQWLQTNQFHWWAILAPDLLILVFFQMCKQKKTSCVSLAGDLLLSLSVSVISRELNYPHPVSSQFRPAFHKYRR